MKYQPTTKLRNITFLMLLFLFIATTSYAQESDVTQLTPKDYLELELPPLAILFENSKQSAAVKYYQIRRQEDESMLKTEKGNWLKYFKILGGYQYGVIGNNVTFSDENTPLFLQYTGNRQSFYNAGIGVSIPLDDIFDRKNRVKRQRLVIQATEVEIEKWHDEQKLRIIERYTEALKDLSLLKVKSQAYILANAQYKLSEQDFMNGIITAQELNRQKSMETIAVTEYEETRANLNNALLQLEVLSKTKIIMK